MALFNESNFILRAQKSQGTIFTLYLCAVRTDGSKYNGTDQQRRHAFLSMDYSHGIKCNICGFLKKKMI